MFKKISKLILFMLLAVLFISTDAQSQTKKVQYPVFTISPLGGAQFPIGSLNDNYNTSWNAGMDFVLKINRETAFFLKAGYYDMPLKTGISGPDASIIEITAGPRYTFTSPKIKAQFFLEAGIGAYIFTNKEYTVPATETSPSMIIPSSSKTNFGVNVGPGVILPMGSVADLVIKSKLHYIFNKDQAQTFLGAVIGLDFKL